VIDRSEVFEKFLEDIFALLKVLEAYPLIVKMGRI